MTVDELVLQGAGRDLQPDVVAPVPDMVSPVVDDLDETEFEEEAGDELIAESPSTETETSSALVSSSDEQAATNESSKDEKQ